MTGSFKGARSPITRDGARQAAQRELKKGIYHRNGEPLPVRLVRAVGRFLDHGLNKAFRSGAGGNLGALAVVLVVIALVVVVIWRVGPPRRAAAGGAVLSGDRMVTASEHRGRSEQAAARGDWSTAVIERMRAVARELEQQSVLDPRAGRTATELAREAGELLPAVAPELSRAAVRFNDVAYGGTTATADSLQVVVAADDGVRARARSRVHAE